MDRRSTREVAVAIAACAGVLLLADLGLGWFSILVTAAANFSIKVTATGWTNVGLIAGFVTIAMLVTLVRPFSPAGVVSVQQAAVTSALGIASIGFTIAAAFTGTTSVSASPGTLEVATRQGPAYAGIALAVVAGLGAVIASVEVMRGNTLRAG